MGIYGQEVGRAADLVLAEWDNDAAMAVPQMPGGDAEEDGFTELKEA